MFIWAIDPITKEIEQLETTKLEKKNYNEASSVS